VKPDTNLAEAEDKEAGL